MQRTSAIIILSWSEICSWHYRYMFWQILIKYSLL